MYINVYAYVDIDKIRIDSLFYHNVNEESG